MDRNLAWHCIRAEVSVALRKESVDRNYGDDLTFADGVGRSPQGERG